MIEEAAEREDNHFCNSKLFGLFDLSTIQSCIGWFSVSRPSVTGNWQKGAHDLYSPSHVQCLVIPSCFLFSF